VEQVGLRFEPRAQALDKLPVLLRFVAFGDDDKVVLGGKFLFKVEEILVVLFVGADKVVAAGIKLEAGEVFSKTKGRVINTHGEEQQLRIKKEFPVMKNRTSEPGEGPRHRSVFPELLDLHESRERREVRLLISSKFKGRYFKAKVRSIQTVEQNLWFTDLPFDARAISFRDILGELGIRVNLFDIIVVL